MNKFQQKNSFIIGILFFSLLFASINVRAASYNLGVNEDEKFEYVVQTVDRDKLEDAFGFDNNPNENSQSSGTYFPDWWQYREGEKLEKYQIQNIDEENVDTYETEMFIVTLDWWDGVGSEGYYSEPDLKGDEKDITNSTDDEGLVLYIYTDPEDLNAVTNNSVSWMYCVTEFIPTPVSEYLDEIEWEDEANAEYSSEENIVTFEGKIGSDEDGDEVEGFKKWTYNNQGVLQSFEVLDEEEELLYKLGTGGFIPGYSIPIFLGFLVFTSLGLIYIVMKKRNNIP